MPYCDYLARQSSVYCGSHLKRFERYGDPEIRQGPGRRDFVVKECSVDGCTNNSKCRGWCNAHYLKWKIYGTPEGRPKAPAKKQMNNTEGYVWLVRPEHPNCFKNGRVAQHTVVMSEMIGRPLVKGETVHHKNGVRDDNRPENLELWVVSQPRGQRPEDLVVWAKEILERYEDPKDDK